MSKRSLTMAAALLLSYFVAGTQTASAGGLDDKLPALEGPQGLETLVLLPKKAHQGTDRLRQIHGAGEQSYTGATEPCIWPAGCPKKSQR
jgi:hypothetical protein